MSNILVTAHFKSLFEAALISAAIPSAQGAPVRVLDKAPVGWVVPEADLPALYVFTSGELLNYEALDEVVRTQFIEVAVMAGGSSPADDLDAAQLGVERLVISSAGFDLARSFRLVSVEVAQNAGALVLSARVMKFEIVFGIEPGDPSL